MAYARCRVTCSLEHASALRPLVLRCVNQRRRVASNCLLRLHPLRTNVPLFYNTASVPGLHTARMASSFDESGTNRIEREDGPEINPKEGWGHDATSSDNACQQPGGGVAQQEGGEGPGQGELEESIGDCQQALHEHNQGRERLVSDGEVDGSRQDDRAEEAEQHVEGEGPSCSYGRGEESEGETGPMDVQQSVTAEAVAEGLIPHGKFTSEIFKVEVRNLPSVGYAVSWYPVSGTALPQLARDTHKCHRVAARCVNTVWSTVLSTVLSVPKNFPQVRQ